MSIAEKTQQEIYELTTETSARFRRYGVALLVLSLLLLIVMVVEIVNGSESSVSSFLMMIIFFTFGALVESFIHTGDVREVRYRQVLASLDPQEPVIPHVPNSPVKPE